MNELQRSVKISKKDSKVANTELWLPIYKSQMQVIFQNFWKFKIWPKIFVKLATLTMQWWLPSECRRTNAGNLRSQQLILVQALSCASPWSQFPHQSWCWRSCFQSSFWRKILEDLHQLGDKPYWSNLVGMWNKFRQIGKSRHLQGPHVVEGQNANLLQGPFRKEWRNRPKVDVRKPPFPKIRGYIMWFTI